MKIYDEYIGKIYGELRITDVFRINKYRVFAKCECSCGNIKNMRLDGIVSKRILSCGCSRGHTRWRKTSDIEVGKRYGRLVIVEIKRETRRDNLNRTRAKAICRCDCGTTKEINLDSMKSGKIVSCGCYQREINRKIKTIHGKHDHPLYKVWSSMKQRCTNINSMAYKYYGGRGIGFDDRWDKFEEFEEWAISSGYKSGLTLDRINNDDGYYEGNCRWISQKEQMNNMRRNRVLVYGEGSMTVSQWAEKINVKAKTICERIDKLGWSVEKALTTPVKEKRCLVR